ncbi:MAG: SPOR domain-containing protein [Woeseiaceae bacterium]|nr:SPOR domain-containing protein [Woeseiaceae bacterium]
MAQRKKRRTKRRTTKKQEYPGWVWMLFGLGIGLSVAFAVYMQDASPPEQPQQAAREPASLGNALDDNAEQGAANEPLPERKKSRFDFYEMLPNFEVVIPEEEPEVARDRELSAVEEPGVYVLQAGSFTQLADADRRRAQLAMQGIESQIQRVTIDDKTYHRVRIGPTDDLDELNLLRSRLRAAQIDVLRIRLGD